MNRAPTAVEAAILAHGRAALIEQRKSGQGRGKPQIGMREAGVTPSPGRNFRCSKCGETLSWPGADYVCPAGRAGWINLGWRP